nr:nucleotide-binding alpha-beta plait domain-containing protein [Tanacetum cinerariifolium]
ITNFPEATSAKELFQACNQYGHVMDCFIPNKKSKIANEGFTDIVIKYMGELWVMLEFKSASLVLKFKESIGAMSWFSQVTDVTNEFEDTEDDDINSVDEGDAEHKPDDYDINNDEEKVPDTCFEEEEETKNIGKQSDVKSYKGVLNGIKNKEIEIMNSAPSVVLGEECVMSNNILNAIFGRINEFVFLANLKLALANEGFTDIVIKYMGELWVMLEFKSASSVLKFKESIGAMSWFSQVIEVTNEFEVKGRIAWIEVEGVPFRLWKRNTFARIANKWGKLLDVDDQDDSCFHSKRLCVQMKSSKSIQEEFKIINQGKVYWI